MKKIYISTFLILFLFNSCALNTIDMYKDEINELTQDHNSTQFKVNKNDINDLKDCEILLEMIRWSITYSGKNNEYKYYGRSQHWIKGTMNTETGVSIDFNLQQNSKYFLNQNLIYPVYIGPWHYSPSIQKQIRFFAYYPKEGGDIQYQYESMTFDNKNIPEKKFSLSPTAKYAPDRFGLCAVKWTAKYGYNAIAEVKSKNPFSKNYLIPTGRIIEAKE